MKRQLRRNFATAPPFTPDFGRAPEPSVSKLETKPTAAPSPTKTVGQPTVAADLRVEEIIFKSYLFEKDRAEANARLYHQQVAKTRKLEDTFKKFKLKMMTRKLIPAHDPKVTQ